jgi:hypothetical protein
LSRIIKKLLVKLLVFKATGSISGRNFHIKNELCEGRKEISSAFTTLLLYTFMDHANHSCFPSHPFLGGDSWHLYERRRRAIPGAKGPTCTSLSLLPPYKNLGKMSLPHFAC